MKTIINLDEFMRLDAAHLANSALVCSKCGGWHNIPFGQITIGEGEVGAIESIAGSILRSRPKKAIVFYDRRIEEFISDEVLTKLRSQNLRFDVHPLGNPDDILESEDWIGNQAANTTDPEADILIGAGSGVISDLTKWIATQLEKPFILCGTAPSMNGYTSITATITENGIKKSELLAPANAVVADINLMSQAPISMIQAGMEDLTARAICNADWKLSSLLKGTFFCPVPFGMTSENEKAYLAVAEGIGSAEAVAIRVLTEANLVSGLSMTILGNNTSPSSGGEHILSHFWDLLVHLRGAPKNLHGSQVGVGTIIMLTLYEYIRKLDIQRIDPVQILRKRLSIEEIEEENKRLYGNQADAFSVVTRQKRIPDGNFVAYIHNILERWDDLWTELSPYIAQVDSIRRPLEAAGVDLTLDAIQRSRAQGIEALCNGNRYRPRYSLLDLAWELGVLPENAELILDLAGV